MDDSQGRVTHSLQRRLSYGVSAVIIVVALLAGSFSFVAALSEANELQDDILRQIAAMYDSHHLPLDQTPSADRLPDRDKANFIFVEPLMPNVTAEHNRAVPRLPSDLPAGMQTVQLPEGEFRIYVRALGNGMKIAVGQDTAARDEIARDSALRTLMPFLILIPVLLWLVRYLVGVLFQPLSRLSGQLDQAESKLERVPSDELPAEVRPFVNAINRLLDRVSRSVAMQRRFVADAAHELRSPLTALSLQSERLQAAEMSDEARQRLETLHQGIRRARSLLDQLLTFARAQDVQESSSETALQPCVLGLIEEMLPLADNRRIDLGISGDGLENDLRVAASEIDLKTLLRNLLDNAIRYTPEGGRVDLSVQTAPDRVILCISDNGPGIAPQERERVFDAFYRVPGSDVSGSGLGLSIVRTVADRLGAGLELGYTDVQTETGLRVELSLRRLTV